MRCSPYLLLLLLLVVGCADPDTPPRPNIILIVADDLGYGDLGSYGQTLIQTPRLDRMADEGLRFTDFYAGATVCAPSRSVLMTGRHGGRTYIRGNKEVRPMGQEPLPDSIYTLAEHLQASGYTTALIGKWGLGGPDSPGLPTRQGFDHFFGYLGQRHAHNYYPAFLFHGEDRVPLRNVMPAPPRGDGSGQAIEKRDYSHDLLADSALAFITRPHEDPFFLLLTVTIPHANNEAGRAGMEVPDYGAYAGRNWPPPQRGAAAMISRLDRDVGRLLDRLQALEIEEHTLVLFTSDNGPHAEGGNDPQFFDSNGLLRGIKRDLYDGGIRVPLIAWWPGVISPGEETDHLSYFGDFFPTFSELSGATMPAGRDGLSMVPTLRSRSEEQPMHPYLYWEFYEGGSAQAVRQGHWKAIRQPMFTGPTALYDLATDLSESYDLAKQHPDRVAALEALMDEAHVPSSLFRLSL